MSALAELQRAFRAHLLHGDARIGRAIAESPVASIETKLGVYAHAYRARLMEALTGDFPKLRQWMGPAAFHVCAAAYVEATASTDPSLRWFGRHLGRFLRESPPRDGHPALAEMADFEWAQGLVFDARDGARMRVEALAAVPAEDWWQLRFEARPSLRRLDLRWNVPVLWKALDAGDPPPEPRRAPGPVGWLLWRRDLEVHWRSLPPDERCALDTLLRGGSFAEVMESLAPFHDEAQLPEHAARCLQQWIADDLIGGYSSPSSKSSRRRNTSAWV